ncbi:MAG TPA: DUF2914 domain-containing protein [Candidatus Paceibacterota bacterium]|nr:DUF2914 domain-containing protein [Candidatus Paceibacterota bacterium]
MARRYFPKSVQDLLWWYERFISPLALVAGFISDNFILLKRVDFWFTDALLFFYLVVSALCIIALNIIESGRVRNQLIVRFAPFIPVVMQFSFGGLFSGYLSLYSRSASFLASWVFVVLLAVLLLGNERFMRLYVRFSFQISVYFGVLFSFLIFFLPIIFHQIGPKMFISSGALSLLVMTLFLMILARLVPEVVKKNKTVIARSIAVIYIMFNILYFNNIIPPLPLALKDSGVYHNVVHLTSGTYELTGEPLAWYQDYLDYNNVFHETPNDRAYVYTSIFAPTGLTTIVQDQWQYYDPAARKWTTTDTIAYEITGGRDAGYEGYTYKGYLTPGDWRVNVLTQYGQIIGRVAFTVVPVSAPVSTVVTDK